MRKPVCKVTLKDLLNYLNAQTEEEELLEPAHAAFHELVFILGESTHPMIWDIEAMKQIVHSCRMQPVSVN